MQVNPKGKRGNKCINFRKKRLFVSYFLVGGKLNKEKKLKDESSM